MKRKTVFIQPETAALKPLTFNQEICDGCNKCVEVCQVDIFVPHPNKGNPPLVAYPGECWYGGCCVAICPRPGAIKLNMPLMNRAYWKKKV
jgi:NAD-dependent dihydropyrimidine dehydrogenase PreA subunit